MSSPWCIGILGFSKSLAIGVIKIIKICLITSLSYHCRYVVILICIRVSSLYWENGAHALLGISNTVYTRLFYNYKCGPMKSVEPYHVTALYLRAILDPREPYFFHIVQYQREVIYTLKHCQGALQWLSFALHVVDINDKEMLTGK